MTVQRIRDFLDEHGVKYVVAEHSRAYTSQEVAAEAHVPGRHFAKTVTVKVDGRMGLAVLPATQQIQLDRLAASLGADSVDIADESELADLFPDCETGAMPPFGTLFDLEVFLSPDLTRAEEIAFNAGTHTEVMRLSYADFERLVQPAVVDM